MEHGDDMGPIEARYPDMPEVGATGQYPAGSLGPHDEGEIACVIKADPETRRVLMVFGKPTAWIAMEPEEARELARLLIHHAHKFDVTR